MQQRKPLDRCVREDVLQRDGYACRKCGSRHSLELHHIVPLAEYGEDTVENLITLCVHCHREWERIVYVYTGYVSFYDWLAIPPVLTLIKAFANEQLWSEEVTAKEVRIAIIQAYRLARAIMLAEEELKEMEQAVIDAAHNNDEHLDNLLDETLEEMDGVQATCLLDHVSQIMAKNVLDARKWKAQPLWQMA